MNGGAKLYYTTAAGVDTAPLGDYNLGTGILGKYSPAQGNSTPIMLENFLDGLPNPLDYNPLANFSLNFVKFDNKNDLENDIFSNHYTLPTIVGGYYFDKVKSQKKGYL